MRKYFTMVIMIAAMIVMVSAQGQKNMEKKEIMMNLHEKIQTQFGELIKKNAVEIEKIRIELERNQLNQKEELMKETPDWAKVTKFMDYATTLRNKIAKIHQEQFIVIAKTLTVEERMMMGKMMKDRMGDHFDGKDGQMMGKHKKNGKGPGMMDDQDDRGPETMHDNCPMNGK